ncbi:MAG: hypothetical protein WAT09_07205 [Paracoccaceae bacterium]
MITLETEGRGGRDSLRKLIDLHGGTIDVGIVTTAASENTLERSFPASAKDFDERLKGVGLDHISKVLTVAIFELTYWDYSCWAREDYAETIGALWGIVLPTNISNEFAQFAAINEISEHESITSPSYFKWRNKWCDVHSLYAHLISGRDVFVSGDVKNFRGQKADQLAKLGISNICSYDEALKKALAL